MGDRRRQKAGCRILRSGSTLALQFGPPGTARHLHQLGEQALRARQSAANRAESAPPMPTRVSLLGKSWPLASIWVPTRMSASPPWIARAVPPTACGFSSPNRGQPQDAGFRNRSCNRFSRRWVPRPKGMDVLVAAGRAGRATIFQAAVVAAQAPVGQVQHRGWRRIAAARYPAAGRAGHTGA